MEGGVGWSELAWAGEEGLVPSTAVTAVCWGEEE